MSGSTPLFPAMEITLANLCMTACIAFLIGAFAGYKIKEDEDSSNNKRLQK